MVGRLTRAAGLRLFLLLITYVVVVVLAHVAITAASVRIQHLSAVQILQLAWESATDYFVGLSRGALREPTSTSILGGQARSMTALLLDAYPKSIALLLLSLVVATTLGVALGIAAAAANRRRFRGAVLGIVALTISTPSFLLAVLLILLSTTMVSRYGVRLWPSFGFGWDEHLILPVIVLAARPFAQIASVTYVSLDEVLRSEYVRAARAKGLPADVLLRRHVLPNGGVAILGAIATALSMALSTLPLVEVFFSWPGLGLALLQSIQRLDAVTAGTLLGTLAVTVAIGRSALDAVAGRLVHAATGGPV